MLEGDMKIRQNRHEHVRIGTQNTASQNYYSKTYQRRLLVVSRKQKLKLFILTFDYFSFGQEENVGRLTNPLQHF